MDINKPMGGTELMYEELKKRLPQYFEKYSIFNYPVQADPTKRMIYWNQLSYDQPIVQFLKDDKTAIDQIDKFVFVSHWQAEKFREKFQIPGYKTHVIKNACIDGDTFYRSFKVYKEDDILKICYTSTPWRGLDVLLRAWEILNPQNCELHIFSSAKIYGKDFAESEEAKYTELYQKAEALPGVVYRGSIPNDLLRKELSTFDIFAYPCTFEETSCIAVIEALCAGLRVITSNLGALPETTEGWARVYPYRVDKEKHAELFAKILKEEIEELRGGNQNTRSFQTQYQYDWSWDSREKDWLKFFKEMDLESFITRNSWDIQIFDDVYNKNEYKIGFFKKDDVVIDIGAHIGSFSKLCLDRGAGTVVAYEPFKENYNTLVENLKEYPNSHTHLSAVWGHRIGIAPFQTKVELDPTNMGLPTMFTKTADTTVDTTGIDDILSSFEKIRLLKIDAEGSEYSILFESKLLDKVNEIVGEIHDIVSDNHLTTPNLDINHSIKSDDLIAHLESQGFNVEIYYPHEWRNCRSFRATKRKA